MAANSLKLSATALLILYGMVVLQLGQSQTDACPLYCLEVAYMTCPSTGTEQLPAGCNCCLTPKSTGCTLHLSDGSTLSCP